MNNDSYTFGAKGGNATEDKVFFLSSTEAGDYFDGNIYYYPLGAENYNQKLLCKPTAYAKAQGIGAFDNRDNKYPADTVGCSWWWLRSPAMFQNFALYVDYSGTFNHNLLEFDNGVRPAILIE